MGDFFPYHPLRLRLWLAGGLVASLALTAWAVVSFVGTDTPREILRAGLSSGLAAAFAVAVARSGPKPGWGVRVTPLSVLVSRPSGQGVIEVPWSAVKEVRRFGERRETLGLWLDEHERVLIPAHLFPDRAAFEALARALDERMPEQKQRLH
ncbi:MAG: hypothetical protein ACOZQL_20610 [Myxococcota bacterium]